MGIAEIRLEDREQIVTQMANHFAVLQIKGELDQILCGLSETLDTLELIRSNPAVMRPLFISSDSPPLTADGVFDMFFMSYSPQGSNAREQEESVGLHWYGFLQKVEG